MDWKDIKKKLKPGDAHALHGDCMRNSPIFTKIDNEKVADFLTHLVAERETFETVEAWHARLDVVAGGPDFGRSEYAVRRTLRRLVRIVEAVSGVTDDETFPTEENREQARMAAVLRQRLPAPVPVDPTLQGRLDFPFTRKGMQAIVEAHVTAWLTDGQGLVLPSPVKRFVCVRKWGKGKYAARVRLFDDAPATIYVEGEAKVGVMPNIRHDGPGFFFHRSGGHWHRAHRDQSRADVLNQYGHDFA